MKQYDTKLMQAFHKDCLLRLMHYLNYVTVEIPRKCLNQSGILPEIFPENKTTALIVSDSMSSMGKYFF